MRSAQKQVLTLARVTIGKGQKMQIINRLKEPSTWAGISALGVLIGLPLGTIDAVGQVIGGIAALAAIFMAEKK